VELPFGWPGLVGPEAEFPQTAHWLLAGANDWRRNSGLVGRPEFAVSEFSLRELFSKVLTLTSVMLRVQSTRSNFLLECGDLSPIFVGRYFVRESISSRSVNDLGAKPPKAKAVKVTALQRVVSSTTGMFPQTDQASFSGVFFLHRQDAFHNPPVLGSSVLT